MESFLVSTGVVAVAEIGDKTQLLALVLAARFRKPAPIILGILVATLANHGLAAWVGLLVANWLGGEALRWILGLSFLAMAVWIMVTAGTTLGMMLANVPAVLVGKAAATAIPMKLVHGIAAIIFAALGIMALLNIGDVFAFE